MYFWTPRGLIENKRFRTGLFRRVVAQAGTVTCQNGKSIGSLNYLASSEETPYASKISVITAAAL
jgi:hypothetical protein